MDLTTALFVFMLAAFLGPDILRHVSRLLRTPLMSLTTAISSMALVNSGFADDVVTHLTGEGSGS